MLLKTNAEGFAQSVADNLVAAGWLIISLLLGLMAGGLFLAICVLSAPAAIADTALRNARKWLKHVECRRSQQPYRRSKGA